MIVVKRVGRYRKGGYIYGYVRYLPSEWIGKKVVIVPEEEYENRANSVLKVRTANLLLNLVRPKDRMFSVVTKTWNPVSGCLHNCKYCWARRLAETKLKDKPRYRRGFIPRLNRNEFKVRFKDGDFVFVVDMGDLFGHWVPREWILSVINHIKRFPKTHFLLLTKNPARYREFLREFPENTFLGATIETNRDDLIRDMGISSAPLPSERYRAMAELDWDKKFIAIEPILDFDLEEFVGWIREIDPLIVYIGYDNYDNCLPEPELAKTLKLIERLEEFTLVLRKTIRRAYWEEVSSYGIAKV